MCPRENEVGKKKAAPLVLEGTVELLVERHKLDAAPSSRNAASPRALAPIPRCSVGVAGSGGRGAGTGGCGVRRGVGGCVLHQERMLAEKGGLVLQQGGVVVTIHLLVRGVKIKVSVCCCDDGVPR